LGREEAAAKDRSAKLEAMWASIEGLYDDRAEARRGEFFDIP
jgi:hypothetical protein